MLDVGRWAFAPGVRLFNFTKLLRQFLVEKFGAWPFRSRPAVALMNKFHHLFERGAGEKNFIYAFAFHRNGVLMRDGAAAASENLDVVAALLAQQIDNCCKEFDVPAVVT